MRRRIGDLRRLYGGGWGGAFGVVATAVAFPEAKGFPPGAHQVHKSGMKQAKIDQRKKNETWGCQKGDTPREQRKKRRC